MGDKCKLVRPKAPKVRDICGRQVWETSVNSCGPRHPEWETSVGDKWETSVNSCGPKHPEWETKRGRQVVDKRKLMRPKEPRM